MSPRSFALLLLAAAASVGLAAWAVADRDLPVSASTAGGLLAPGLADRLEEVATVTVQSRGATVTVARDGERWLLQEKGGYPVDPAKVRDLVLAVASTELVEAKTDKAERLERLELGPVDVADARSKLVRIAGEGGEELAAVVVGKTRYGLYGAGRGGVYVRAADGTQAWLANRTIEVPGEPVDWLDRTVVDLPKERIAEVALKLDTPEPVVLARSGEAAEPTLAAVPEGREIDPEKLGRITSFLSSLTMQDVKPAAEVAFGDARPTARFTTADGTTIEAAQVVEGEGGDAVHWVRFTVEPGAPPPVAPPAPEAAAAAPTAGQSDAPPAAPPASGPTGAELERRLEGWAFKLPKYLAERLTWGADDLLKPQDKTS